MQSKAATVAEYIASLPEDRKAAISAVRSVILKNIDMGFREGMTYGMIGYYVPHSTYPAGYHCDPRQPLPFAGLASQKQYMSLYLTTSYGRGEFWNWFEAAWKRTGKKLDMGKVCIRFKKLEDLPLELVGEAFRRITVEDHIAEYERLRDSTKKELKTARGSDDATAAKKTGTVKRATAEGKRAVKKTAKRPSAKKSVTKGSAKKTSRASR